MNRSLVLITIVFCSVFALKSFAQTTPPDTILPRIVYTNSERTAIIAKNLGWEKPDTIFSSYYVKDKPKSNIIFRNLAVLASTPDGKSLLIAGRVFFWDGLHSKQDSVWVVARIDDPFKNTGAINLFTPPYVIGNATLLKVIYTDQDLDPFIKMLPLGVISGNDWFFTPSKVSVNQQWFFHGKFDGKGVVDSVQVVGAPASSPLYPHFHMTNLAAATLPTGTTMFAVVFDGLKSERPRAQVFSWNPSIPDAGFAFQARDISGQIKSNTRHPQAFDSSFCFLLKIHDATFADLGLDLDLNGDKPGDINLYQFPLSGSINGLTSTGIMYDHRKLPKDSKGRPLHFWTGYTAEPANVNDDKEVINNSRGYPNGNGGDVMYNADETKIVFVTSDTTNVATAAESGIYIMDLNTGKVDSVINDRGKMERQPIFAGTVVHKYIKPPPGPHIPGVAILDTAYLDFGVDSISDPSGTRFFNLKDTSASPMYVISATVVGTAGSGIFTLTPNTFTSPRLVASKANLAFTAYFTPTAEKTYFDTLVITYEDTLGSDKFTTLRLPVTGTGIKKWVDTTTHHGSVHSKAPASFDLSVMPNPFTASTQIVVTAKQAASSTLEIRDLLGKNVYSSRSFMLGAGEKFSYTLDANALHLAPGSYFVIIRSGDEEATRQIIYVK